ncbi:hypothetical protein MANES_11G121666v8 [Manihot esculenta]|nr:hypothetical protein MANES_11G121666v8 [Manihot esculenta]
MKEGLANPVTSEAATSKAAIIDCGCTAICFGCPYEINWIQTGRGLIGKYCTCTCNCSLNPFFPSTPSTPQVSITPSTPRVPGVPFVPPTSSPTCAETSVNLGLCWARASVGTVFYNFQLAAGCCDIFTQWSRGCFGGNEEIPRIVSNFVPPALVQYCATHH